MSHASTCYEFWWACNCFAAGSTATFGGSGNSSRELEEIILYALDSGFEAISWEITMEKEMEAICETLDQEQPNLTRRMIMKPLLVILAWYSICTMCGAQAGTQMQDFQSCTWILEHWILQNQIQWMHTLTLMESSGIEFNVCQQIIIWCVTRGRGDGALLLRSMQPNSAERLVELESFSFDFLQQFLALTR